MGKIGMKVPMNMEEKEEDFLERMYLRWREGKSLLLVDFTVEMKTCKRELNSLAKRMLKHGYLEEPMANGELFLTDFGKSQGLECTVRHQKLMQFLQMVSGMEQEEAEQDACRMEHVISGKGMDGISNFLKYGDIYDRNFGHMDLSATYEEGTYDILMAIYEPEKRNPRFLAEEFEKFQTVAALKVKAGESSFFLYLKQGNDAGCLWYKKNEEWILAVRTEDCFRLPTDIFTYTVSAAVPVTEGKAIIAFTENGISPITTDHRELNIHLWQQEGEKENGTGR